jgi:hypothetical protein
MIADPDEWRASLQLRKRVLRDAREIAGTRYVVVNITLRNRFGSNVIGRIDGRYWLFGKDEASDPAGPETERDVAGHFEELVRDGVLRRG